MTLVILFGHRRVFNNYKYTNRQSSYLCASWNPHLFTSNKENKGLIKKTELNCESQIHQLLINTEKDLIFGRGGRKCEQGYRGLEGVGVWNVSMQFIAK